MITTTIFIIAKGAYPYEYFNDWEKCNETSLPQKKIFNVGKGGLANFEYLGEVSKKGGVDIFREGGTEEFLKVIFKC